MKKYISIILVLLVIVGNACFPDFNNKESDRLFLKFIKLPKGNLSWFTYSSSYANSPDFVTLKLEERVDTICRSDNLIDIRLHRDTIYMKFNGNPSLYTAPIKMPSKVERYYLLVDSTHVKNNFKARSFFKM